MEPCQVGNPRQNTVVNTPLVQVFDQILEGYDIPKPEGMLKISEDQAFAELSPLPYSFATNLQHAVLWQRFWLQKLAGGRKKSGMEAVSYTHLITLSGFRSAMAFAVFRQVPGAFQFVR